MTTNSCTGRTTIACSSCTYSAVALLLLYTALHPSRKSLKAPLTAVGTIEVARFEFYDRRIAA